MLGIEHPLLELEALEPRCDPGKIAGRGMAFCAPARAFKVLLARFGVSGLEIGGIHALTSTGFCEHIISLRVDKGNKAGNLLIRTVKAGHALVWASIAHDNP